MIVLDLVLEYLTLIVIEIDTCDKVKLCIIETTAYCSHRFTIMNRI